MGFFFISGVEKVLVTEDGNSCLGVMVVLMVPSQLVPRICHDMRS